MREREAERGEQRDHGDAGRAQRLRASPGPARGARALAQGGQGRRGHHSTSGAARRERAASSTSAKASGMTSRHAGPIPWPEISALEIAASTTPSPRPAANAHSGCEKPTISAATSPLTPSSDPVVTEYGPLGAAAIAMTTASAPTSAKARATNGSTGMPTK